MKYEKTLVCMEVGERMTPGQVKIIEGYFKKYEVLYIPTHPVKRVIGLRVGLNPNRQKNMARAIRGRWR